MSKVMLDASALLAFLHGEPGGEKVPATSGEAVISSVNLAEAVSVLTVQGMNEKQVRNQLSRILLSVVAFNRIMAEDTGLMTATTKPLGLSLGDRACLAVAAREKLPVLTADRSWKAVNIGVRIELIR